MIRTDFLSLIPDDLQENISCNGKSIPLSNKSAQKINGTLQIDLNIKILNHKRMLIQQYFKKSYQVLLRP